jgi:molybdate transport system substrate-binding protein
LCGQSHRRHGGGAIELRATAARRRGLRWIVAPGLLVLLVAGACASDAPSGHDLTVFAAASLRDVFDELEVRWEASHPGAELVVAHDGSNILAAQIAEGAAADVFVSADLKRPRQLVAAGHAAGVAVPFVRNRVTLVAPLGDDRVQTPGDLAVPGTRIVAAGPGVPITHYADQILAQLAETMPDPVAFAEDVAANIVSREDNVRAALAKVELGEGDAAMVYRTDALSSDGVRVVPLPAQIDVTAEYGAVQVSDRPEAAVFVDWLSSRR